MEIVISQGLRKFGMGIVLAGVVWIIWVQVMHVSVRSDLVRKTVLSREVTRFDLSVEARSYSVLLEKIECWFRSKNYQRVQDQAEEKEILSHFGDGQSTPFILKAPCGEETPGNRVIVCVYRYESNAPSSVIVEFWIETVKVNGVVGQWREIALGWLGEFEKEWKDRIRGVF